MCTIHSSSPYNHCYFWNSYIDIKMTLKTRYTFVYNGLICCHIQSDRVVFHFDFFFVIERSKISILILSLLLFISIIIIYYLIFVYKNQEQNPLLKSRSVFCIYPVLIVYCFLKICFLPFY